MFKKSETKTRLDIKNKISAYFPGSKYYKEFFLLLIGVLVYEIVKTSLSSVTSLDSLYLFFRDLGITLIVLFIAGLTYLLFLIFSKGFKVSVIKDVIIDIKEFIFGFFIFLSFDLLKNFTLGQYDPKSVFAGVGVILVAYLILAPLNKKKD